MKELRETYFSIQATLFPVLEEEKFELSGKTEVNAQKYDFSRLFQNKSQKMC